MEALISTLIAILPLIPLIIVWVIGIALALSRWRRHPRVSQFALIAFTLLIVSMVVVKAISILVPLAMRDNGWSTYEIGLFFTAIGIVTSLIHIAAWTLILWAIFGWRDQPKKENLYPPPPAVGNEMREQMATPGFSQQ